MKLDILIAGVGGQGILLCGKILGKYAQIKGLDAKISEVHGMAQRGGSVLTNVRIADHVLSPLIDAGCADAILSFEPMEALRYAKYLQPEGVIVTAADQVMPLAQALSGEGYPKGIMEQLQEQAGRLLVVENAAQMAIEAGSLRSLNIVLLGAFTGMLQLDVNAMEQAITQSVRPQFAEMNQKAFHMGLKLIG